MRRRLTVTGASSTIDGEQPIGKPDPVEGKKQKKKTKVSMPFIFCYFVEISLTPKYFNHSIKLQFAVLSQNILAYQRRVMPLTIPGKRIRMLSSWPTIRAPTV
jgi:hypothetical protein